MENKRFNYDARVYSCDGYVVTTNSDTSEGRGYAIELGVFDRLTEASIAAKNKGVQGSAADIGQRRVSVVVPVVGGTEIWSDARVLKDACPKFETKHVDPGKLRRDALAKLTLDEQVLLGLIDGTERVEPFGMADISDKPPKI